MAATRAIARFVAVGFAVASVLACGGAAAPPATPVTGASGTPSTTAPPIASPGGGTIDDLCALVGEDVVEQALGEAFEGGATETFAGSTSCAFTGGSGDIVEVAVTPGFGSLAGWELQMQTLGMTADHAIPGVGESAYAKSGLPFGGPGAQFAAYDGGTGVDVTIESGRDATELVAAVTTLGQTLVDLLP